MQELPDFVPAFSHYLKPLTRDSSQIACMLFHPGIDGGIPLDSTVESQQFQSHRSPTLSFEIYGCVAYTRRSQAWWLLGNRTLPSSRTATEPEEASTCGGCRLRRAQLN